MAMGNWAYVKIWTAVKGAVQAKVQQHWFDAKLKTQNTPENDNKPIPTNAGLLLCQIIVQH